MKLFVDTDVVVKLTDCGLIDDLPGTFNVSLDDVHVLRTAQYQIRGKGYERQYSAVTRLRARNYLSNRRTVPAPTKALADLMAGVAEIDAGEVILFGSGAEDSDSYVLTDDKRSIRALSRAEGCEKMRSQLQRRVFTLSMIVLKMIRESGFGSVRTRVKVSTRSDHILQNAFKGSAARSQSQVIRVLEADVARLRNDSGSLLGDL